jgi:glucose/mannose-6-phosphate isomerase
MSSILDSREQLKALDKSNLLGSVEALGDQIQDALEQTKNITLPDSYNQDIKNVVVSGMGGSVLASHIIKQLYKSELKVPFDIVSHYDLPGYVNGETLVILASYSGTTEETLESANQAKERGAKVMVITTGGKLAMLAQENNWPSYIIQATYNPCNQPRLAVGYAIVGQLMLLAKAGLISDPAEELQTLIPKLKTICQSLAPESKNNLAKNLTFTAYDKHIVFVAAEHLIGAAHVFNNQINENAKALTSEWHLPEFNHHYMEALSYPKSTKDNTVFFLFNSSLYHPRLQKRVLITKNLLEQKGYEAQVILATSETKLAQVFETIQIGAFIAYYLPMLYGIDPSGIPNVEWFKSEMAK